MKHIFKKKMLQGGGGMFGGKGGNEPQIPEPAVLKPPQLGDYKVLQSYSVAEIIDLISDGPIQGFVNQNGERVSGGDFLQAVYFDDTPVQMTSVFKKIAQQNVIGSFGISEELNKLGELYFEYDEDNIKGRYVQRVYENFRGEKRNLKNIFMLAHMTLVPNASNLKDKSTNPKDKYTLPVDNGLTLKEWIDQKIKEATNAHTGGLTDDKNSGATVTEESKYLYLDRDRAIHFKDWNVGIDGRIEDPSGKIEIVYSNDISKSLILKETLNEMSKRANAYQPPYLQNTENPEMNTGLIGSGENEITKYVTFEERQFIERNLEVYNNLLTRSKETAYNNGILDYITYAYVIINLGRFEILEAKTKQIGYRKTYGSFETKVDDYHISIPELEKFAGRTYSLITPITDFGDGKGSGPRFTQYFYGSIVIELPLSRKELSREIEIPSTSSVASLADQRSVEKRLQENIFKSYSNNPTPAILSSSAKWLDFNFAAKGEVFRDIHIEYHWPNFIRNFSKKNIKLQFNKGLAQQNPFNKFNYSNVAAEYKLGNEKQTPLSNFEDVYVDFLYGTSLIGPYNTSLAVQKLYPIGNQDDIVAIGAEGSQPIYSNPLDPLFSLGSDATPIPGQSAGGGLLTDVAGSSDRRNYRDYTFWSDDYSFSEDPLPFTHTIENPNVEFVFFTLSVDGLTDTVEIDERIFFDDDEEPDSYTTRRSAGEQRPAIVQIEVKIGITKDGFSTTTQTMKYAIVGISNNSCYIDFGCPSLAGESKKNHGAVFDYTNAKTKILGTDVYRYEGQTYADLTIPYELPKINPQDEDLSKVKRFIQIRKISGETYSTLIKRNLSVAKVTEIIRNQLSYPFSALAATKIDARVFSESPDRTFDCRLKKILIPTNYFPIDEEDYDRDRRYITKKSEYDYSNLVYEGDWDGNFKFGWTDNPAWILYDLLTNNRYGLGRFIEERQINKWQLYKIGRFCDAVNEEGYFEGVSDGAGGLEPRYSCNAIIKDAAKIYETIVSIANLFRGSVYYYNSEINFLDDRPRTPIMTFSNINVKNGLFNYSNTRKDQQYNTIEVSYLDRLNNYESKIEYIEDEQDIRKRGISKSRIESFGVTSRAMARRIGQHMIYQTTKENQAVDFIAGLEGLLCRPGDLIIIEDDLKTRALNFGRVLEVDNNEKSLFLENKYLSGKYNGIITLYNPTGNISYEEIKNLANSPRSRLPYFDVLSGLTDNSDNVLTGRYYFDSYKLTNLSEDEFYFPLYTGINNNIKTFCYYNEVATGFVFSTGLAYQNNNLYDKVILNSGVLNILNGIYDSTGAPDESNELKNIYKYDYNSNNKRSGLFNSEDKLFTPFLEEYHGLLESEINTVNNPQIANLHITGFDNTLPYGCKVFLDKTKTNTNIIYNVKPGSPYRIGRNNSADQIYKVLTIREEAQNEYLIAASKYDTGKYTEIENFSSEDILSDTYYSGPLLVNNVSVEQLNPPVITQFTTGSADSNGFSLLGSWSPVPEAQKYKYLIYNEISSSFIENETNDTSFLIKNLNSLGFWKMVVVSSSSDVSKINSDSSISGIFVAYYNNSITPLTKPAILNFTIS